jgi:hypothetical protein
MRHLEHAIGLLALVAVAGCAHREAPSAEPGPSAELEAKARNDVGPDPFRELDAGPPPAPPPPVVEAAPARDPRLDDEAAIHAALKGRDCPAIHAALEAHAQASPAVVREALTAAERCEEKAKDLPAARATAAKLLLTCGPEALARCRSKALGLWRRLAGMAPKEPALANRARDVAEKDACLAKAERQVNGDKPLDACLAQAEALYRAEKDELMRARVKLLRARHAVHRGDAGAEKLLAEAADACTAPRCGAVQGQALEAYAAWAVAQKRSELALEVRLRQDALAARAVPPEKRPYCRSERTDAACAALDAEKSAGSCRALERKVTGHWTFHDWAAREVPGDLPEDQVRRANDDFAITLQDCFHDEAGRLPPPAPGQGPVSQSFKVRWMVTLDGRADQVHLAPPADDAGPLAACLRERFAAWRYPRSHGENQHVEQGFTVSARVR